MTHPSLWALSHETWGNGGYLWPNIDDYVDGKTTQNGRAEDDALDHLGHCGAADPPPLCYNNNSQQQTRILHYLPHVGKLPKDLVWKDHHPACVCMKPSDGSACTSSCLQAEPQGPLCRARGALHCTISIIYHVQVLTIFVINNFKGKHNK